MRAIRRHFACLLLAGLAGCESIDTFRDADMASRRGGSIDQAKAEEQRKQREELARQQALKARQAAAATEAERMQLRIAAAQEQSRQQAAALAQALQSRRISQAQYDALKREHDAVRSDLAALDLQEKNDQFKRRSDPQAEARKEAQLKALQQREADLKERLAAAMKL